jgi:integrase
MERQEKSGRGDSSIASWRHSYDVRCKKIASLDVADITTADVKGVVAPIIEAGTYPSARRTLARIADVLAYAIAHEWRTKANVAEWANIKAVISERPRPDDEEDRHHPMLPWPEAPAFMAALRGIDTMGARCLEIIVLTAVRLSEARLAQWPEFDFEAAIWTVPASRMKPSRKTRRVDFKVPLSDSALALLAELKAHCQTGPVFAGTARNVIWEMCKRLAPKASPHGLRATFRSWCANKGIDDGLAEMCLSHGPGDATKAAYNRDDVVERRRVVMSRWADFLDGKDSAAAVPLKRT